MGSKEEKTVLCAQQQEVYVCRTVESERRGHNEQRNNQFSLTFETDSLRSACAGGQIKVKVTPASRTFLPIWVEREEGKKRGGEKNVSKEECAEQLLDIEQQFCYHATLIFGAGTKTVDAVKQRGRQNETRVIYFYSFHHISAYTDSVYGCHKDFWTMLWCGGGGRTH